MKHTPGPWLIARPKVFGLHQYNDRLIHSEDGKHIAEVFQFQNHMNKDGPSLANANLIAAAPELLEACKKAIPWLITLDNMGTKYQTISQDLTFIENAIAKAEGK